MSWARILALPAALLLGGCVSLGIQAPPLDDLLIEDIMMEPEGLPGHALARGAASPSLFVQVSTQAELTDYRRLFNNSLWVRGAPCWNGDRRLIDAGPIRNHDGSIVDNTAYAGVLSPAREPDGDGRRRYLLAFRIAAPQRQATTLDDTTGILDAHDLRTEPHDLCFRVQGGDMMFAHRSRTHRIPHALIAEALARAGQPHARPAGSP